MKHTTAKPDRVVATVTSRPSSRDPRWNEINVQAGAQAIPAPTPEPTPELRQKINRLFSEVANVEEAVSILITRVQPVTKPLPPTDPCDHCEKNKLPQAEISNDVERVAERLSALVYRVTDIIDNLAI